MEFDVKVIENGDLYWTQEHLKNELFVIKGYCYSEKLPLQLKIYYTRKRENLKKMIDKIEDEMELRGI